MNNRILQVVIHVIVWAFIFIMPFLTFWRNTDDFFYNHLIHQTISVTALMIVFYLNFFWLIDKYLFRKKELQYILWNIFFVLGVAVLMYLIKESFPIRPEFGKFRELGEFGGPPLARHPKAIDALSPVLRLSREFISLILAVGISIALKMTAKWYSTEEERKESEAKQTEAELNNLKQQLNPHFLFNTLNNIYALVEMSPEKAQTAILDLSKMLRYQLYDNNENYALVKNELNFITNYVQLMQLRLNSKVDLKFEINVQSQEKQIVPFMFITLIENAFKHGISSSKKSFIHITVFENENKEVVCRVENSYFPKDDKDRSGSGIGLENLKRRLAILYPSSNLLNIENDGSIFKTVLTLPLN